MKVVKDNKNEIDIVEKIEELNEKYDTVYWTRVNGDIYVYKPLGRKDYVEICEMEVNEELKKDEVVKRTLLYPDDINLGEMVSGEFETLYTTIAKNSFIDNINERLAVTLYYREEMYDVQNQVTCIIKEAFPNYDLEEIENWGIEKSAKYLSRAEWILQNLRGVPMNIEKASEEISKMLQKNIGKEEKENNKDNQKQNINQNNKTNKNKMSLAELKRKFPEVNWGDEDSVMEEGLDAFNDHVNTIPVALRTPE